MLPPSGTQPVIDALEHDLIGGRARWVADLNEFFRNYQVRDTTFDLYARGRTRNKGLLLSKFFAWTALPDYSVSLFCVDESRGGNLNIDKLRRRMEAVFYVIREEGLQWAWLIVFLSKELPAQVVSFVTRYDRRELGLALASTSSGQVVTSYNQIGRSIGKQLRLGKLLKRSQHGKTN